MSFMASQITHMFLQQYIQAKIKENIKTPYDWPFVRGIH